MKFAALLGSALLAVATLSGCATDSTAEAPTSKVVYHINDASVARVAMNNVKNHKQAEPGAKIVVVTHGKGIDFLLNDAKDAAGESYTAQVAGLKDMGVDFRVCANTLKARKLDNSAVILDATVVPSGVAEIGKLQAREGYVYVKP
jgi:intracellular sulfur oxidation DsrE/DsrF family protein